MKYSLASRELIADSVEVMARAHPFDALVLIPNCDKIIPGMLMAMLRLNIPAIMISGGPMLTGRWRKKDVHLISIFEGVGQVKSGNDEGPGSAGTGRCGLSGMRFLRRHVYGQLHELPDRGHRSGTSGKRNHPGRLRGADSFGQAGRDEGHGTVEKNIRPRDIATMAAFRNAIAVDMALGCSTNTVLHVPAIAHEAHLELPLDLFNQISKRTPHLCSLIPGGPTVCRNWMKPEGFRRSWPS